jgi:lysophospholipase L1-like esterase
MTHTAVRLVTALLLAVVLLSAADAQQRNRPYQKNRNYAVQRDLYAIYRTTQADVVMLGNSITYGVAWQELLGRPGVVNRGISSDVTEGFLKRLEDIYRIHPRLCCIMGGVNDIFSDIPLDTVLANYLAVVEGLRSHGITPVIQSTLYAAKSWKNAARYNPDVQALNLRLEEYARANGIEFIDLNRLMADGWMMRDSLVYDGLHINARGYAIWRDALEPILERNGL